MALQKLVRRKRVNMKRVMRMRSSPNLAARLAARFRREHRRRPFRPCDQNIRRYCMR